MDEESYEAKYLRLTRSGDIISEEARRGMDFDPILPIFESDSRVLGLYVLGSANSGGMRADSDVDLALMLEPGARMDALERATLAADAAYVLHREVDLGEVSSANLVYSREAILKGCRLMARDEGRVELTEATLLGMYARFHDERKEVAAGYDFG
jgi:predicted nucleotidyltransferase